MDGEPGIKTSPHPQPQLTYQPQAGVPSTAHKTRTALIWIGVAVVIAGIAFYAHYSSKQGSAAKANARGARPVQVVASLAVNGDLPIYLKGLGYVTPFSTVTVHTRVDGQIMKLSFQEGQIVHEGDTLAEIDPRPFQVQLSQAQAQLAKDTAARDNAKGNVAMDTSAANAISQQQLSNDTATLAQDEAAMKIDQAMIDSANLELIYCHITSPITGRVGLQLVNLGNIVHAADTNGLVVIDQLQPISVEFSLPEVDISQIMGESADAPQLKAVAYDETDATQLSVGELTAIDSQIDQTTGMVKLKAKFDNQKNELFPNEFVNVHLLVDTKKNVVIVPAAAVQRGPDSTFVYVVNTDTSAKPQPDASTNAGTANGGTTQPAAQKVEQRTVTLGPTQGDQVAIASGLNGGEMVVIIGVDKLEDGSAVNAQLEKDANAATTRPATTQHSGRKHKTQ